jgi:hypothetical protein
MLQVPYFAQKHENGCGPAAMLMGALKCDGLSPDIARLPSGIYRGV